MKLALSLFAFAVTTSAFADWVIVEQTKAGEKDQKKLTIQIKDGKMRTDIGDDITALVGEDGTTQMFIHKMKKVMVVNAEMQKSASAMANMVTGGAGSGTPAKPVATGEKAQVGQWDTEIYTWEGTMGKAKLYVAKDFPKFAELAKVMDKAKKATSNPMTSMFPDASEFPGMIVKSEMTMMGKVTTTELVSAKEENVDASVFKGPEGYDEMKMPKMPGGVKAPR